jgi:hypothetical protein
MNFSNRTEGNFIEIGRACGTSRARRTCVEVIIAYHRRIINRLYSRFSALRNNHRAPRFRRRNYIVYHATSGRPAPRKSLATLPAFLPVRPVFFRFDLN